MAVASAANSGKREGRQWWSKQRQRKALARADNNQPKSGSNGSRNGAGDGGDGGSRSSGNGDGGNDGDNAAAMAAVTAAPT
jgi:hypothetical protein